MWKGKVLPSVARNTVPVIMKKIGCHITDQLKRSAKSLVFSTYNYDIAITKMQPPKSQPVFGTHFDTSLREPQKVLFKQCHLGFSLLFRRNLFQTSMTASVISVSVRQIHSTRRESFVEREHVTEEDWIRCEKIVNEIEQDYANVDWGNVVNDISTFKKKAVKLIVHYCLRSEKDSLVTDFLQYIQQNESALYPTALFQVLGFNCKGEGFLFRKGAVSNQELILDVLEKFDTIMKAYNNSMFTTVLFALESSGSWSSERANQIYRKLLPNANAGNTFNLLAVKACINQRKEEEVWKYVDEFASAEASNGNARMFIFVNDILQFLMGHCDGKNSSSTTLNIVLQLLSRLVEVPYFVMTLENAKNIVALTNKQKRFEMRAVLSEAKEVSSDSCVCPLCSTSLSAVQITDEEHREVQEKLQLAATDVSRHMINPEELGRFMKFLAQNGPFDAVVDLLNVAHQKKDMKTVYRTRRVGDVVHWLKERGKEQILFICREHAGLRIQRDSYFKKLMTMNKQFKMFLTQNDSHDDMYQLLAALHGGPGCLLLSSDLYRSEPVMRELLQLEKNDSNFLIQRWQILHCAFMQERLQQLNNKTGDIVLANRLDRRVHKDSDGFHIPVVTETLGARNLTRFSNKMLCLRIRDETIIKNNSRSENKPRSGRKI